MARIWRLGSDHEKASVSRSIPSRGGSSRMTRILFQLASMSLVLFRDTMIVMGTILHQGVVGIGTHFSNRGLVKMISVSSHSHTASRAGPSKAIGPKDDMYFDDLLYFDEEIDMATDDSAVPKPSTPGCHPRGLRYPLGQAKANAYIGEMDDCIEDNHL